MRIALDTMVLAYAEGVDGPERQARTMTVLSRFIEVDIVLPTQTIGELYNVLTRRSRLSTADARRRLSDWIEGYRLHPADEAVFASALALAADKGLQFWDALILATAADADCLLLLSEDFQEGFVWRGVTVVNPYAASPHPLLAAVLKAARSRQEPPL
jgi:predicted nucleic acid-binding protein